MASNATPALKRPAITAPVHPRCVERDACQNRIRALFATHAVAMPAGAKTWTADGLDVLGAEARELAGCGPDELWRGMLGIAVHQYRELEHRIAQAERVLDQLSAADPGTQLLLSIPGVGPRTAEAVAAHLGDTKRFGSGKQVGAYAGLVPTQYQSGVTDRKGRITRRGPAVLRKLLVKCSWCMLRYNPWAQAQYRRLTGGGLSRKKPAVVALARKLLVRCWAMLRTNQRARLLGTRVERKRVAKLLPSDGRDERIAKYERHLHSLLTSTLHELERLQVRRTENTVPPPAIADVNVVIEAAGGA